MQGNVNFLRSEVVLHLRGTLTGAVTPLTSNQVYVRNLVSGDVELISAKPDGGITEGTVSSGTISPSGRFVAFYSGTSDLTSDNPLGQTQLFLRDRITQTTRRLTFSSGGGEFTSPFILFGPLQFPDDNTLVFSSPSRELTSNGTSLPPTNVFELKLGTGLVTVASVGVGGLIPNGQSSNGQISADGRFVAFTSRATNLTAPPLPDGVYVRDRLADEIVNVSASLGPLEPNTIPNVALSADGSVVSFDWWHANSVPVVGGRILIYSVSVRGSVPFVAPVPVPTRSLTAMAALIALLVTVSLLRHVRTSERLAVGQRVD